MNIKKLLAGMFMAISLFGSAVVFGSEEAAEDEDFDWEIVTHEDADAAEKELDAQAEEEESTTKMTQNQKEKYNKEMDKTGNKPETKKLSPTEQAAFARHKADLAKNIVDTPAKKVGDSDAQGPALIDFKTKSENEAKKHALNKKVDDAIKTSKKSGADLLKLADIANELQELSQNSEISPEKKQLIKGSLEKISDSLSDKVAVKETRVKKVPFKDVVKAVLDKVKSDLEDKKKILSDDTKLKNESKQASEDEHLPDHLKKESLDELAEFAKTFKKSKKGESSGETTSEASGPGTTGFKRKLDSLQEMADELAKSSKRLKFKKSARALTDNQVTELKSEIGAKQDKVKNLQTLLDLGN